MKRLPTAVPTFTCNEKDDSIDIRRKSGGSVVIACSARGIVIEAAAVVAPAEVDHHDEHTR